jgi:hypothetical protein
LHQQATVFRDWRQIMVDGHFRLQFSGYLSAAWPASAIKHSVLPGIFLEVFEHTPGRKPAHLMLGE